jgi:hypothetical protein
MFVAEAWKLIMKMLKLKRRYLKARIALDDGTLWKTLHEDEGWLYL